MEWHGHELQWDLIRCSAHRFNVKDSRSLGESLLLIRGFSGTLRFRWGPAGAARAAIPARAAARGGRPPDIQRAFTTQLSAMQRWRLQQEQQLVVAMTLQQDYFGFFGSGIQGARPVMPGVQPQPCHHGLGRIEPWDRSIAPFLASPSLAFALLPHPGSLGAPRLPCLQSSEHPLLSPRSPGSAAGFGPKPFQARQILSVASNGKSHLLRRRGILWSRRRAGALAIS